MQPPIDITANGNMVNSGTSTDFVQWENSHVSIRFPLEDDQSVVSVDGRSLPMDFVVDMSVFTDGDPLSVRLVSAYMGPGLLSMSLVDNLGALGMCSVSLSDYEPYAPYRIEGFPGRDASGICSFGVDPSLCEEPSLFKFSPGILVSSTACYHVNTGRIRRFVDERSGQSVSGDVKLDLGTGLTAFMYNFSDSEVLYTEWPCARIFMNSDLRNSVISPCLRKREDDKLIEKPISSINGIPPTCDGEFAIVFS